MKKILLSVMFIVASAFTAVAQNDIQFSNYMFSEVTYNPAMAGNSGTLDACLLHRMQWTGFDEAPRTQLLSVHSFVDKLSGGVGLSVINDKLGHENSINAKLMYAYHLRLNDKSHMSFGLGFGMVNRVLKGSELIYDDMTDENAVLTDETHMKPDFDFGIGYTSEKFCAGISSTHIDQPLNKATVLKVPRHYYLYAKYKIKAGEKINVIPSVKVRSAGYITQFDVSAMMYYASRFWIGASFRSQDAVVGFAGIDITKNFRLGYSYDYNSGAVKSYSGGSHEIMLLASFDVSKKVIPVKTPRFFD